MSQVFTLVSIFIFLYKILYQLSLVPEGWFHRRLDEKEVNRRI